MENMDAHTTQALALSLLLTASVPLLPPGWQIARDPASGKFYFYNTSTGVVQWEPPLAAGANAQLAAAASAAAAAVENGGEVQIGGPGSAVSALMGAAAKRGAPEPLSAAGVLLAGAGGAQSHHAEKRQRLGEGRQSDYEEEVVAKLTTWCGDPTTWNTKKKIIELFKASTMWVSWVKAGHNEQKLVNFINRLKIKHLEDGHNKDNGAGVAEFEQEVIEKLNQWCGETPTWNTKKKVIENFKENPFWAKWQAAGHSEQKLVNLINRLKIRHTEEAAKAAAANANALAAQNGTAPPVVTTVQGAVGGVSAFEQDVVSQLGTLCGEPQTWNTKKKVIDAFKASPMWDAWITAGHNDQKLVNFINRLKIKHLEENGGSATSGGGVSSFEPQVVAQLTRICGQNASTWNTKKVVMDQLKNSELWPGWSTTGHTEQQLVNFINRLKMKHLKEELPVPVKMLTIREGAAAPMQLPGMPAGLPSASGLAAAQALFGAVQASVAEAKPNEDTEDDEPAKDALKTGKEGDAEGKDKEGVKMEDGALAGMAGIDKGKDEAVAKVVEALSSVMPSGPGVPPPPSPPKEA